VLYPAELPGGAHADPCMSPCAVRFKVRSLDPRPRIVVPPWGEGSQGSMNFETYTQPMLDFVRANQGWAPFIVGALAFGESLAIVSVLIPATVFLVAIGALIGGAGLEFWPIWLGAVVGAILGDWVSYEVARYLGPSIQHSWPLNKRPDLMEKTGALMQKYGAWAVFFGRFSGPLRALVPLFAGIFLMPRFLFQMANVASALVWATALLAPGAGLLGWLEGR
jgi:membrane protein DedA with SNARE-associated domain